MGTGEKHPTTEHEVKDVLLNPQTIQTKDPESATATHTKGYWQNLQSRKGPLLYVVYGAAAGAIIVIILLIVIAVLSQRNITVEIEKTTCAQCKHGWITYKVRCYYLSENLDTWNNSQKFCKQNKSSLAIIDNKEEYDFLTRIKSVDDYWIGLSRTKDDSGWVWTDGTPYLESNDLFTIERLPIKEGELEHAYLNHDGVKSESETVVTKSICSMDLLFQSS